MDTALEAQLDGIFAARDRENMAPTIAALLPICEQHPHDPRVLYEMGGAYDTDGQEETALGFYQKAMAAGPDGDVLRRCYLQLGSTLRNLGRIEESISVFSRARADFPESISLGVFESLTLHAAGQVNTALGSLIVLLADHVSSDEVDRYKPAMRGNADHLASLDVPEQTSGR